MPLQDSTERGHMTPWLQVVFAVLEVTMLYVLVVTVASHRSATFHVFPFLIKARTEIGV